MEHLHDYILLNTVKGLGYKKTERLLRVFGDAKAVLKAKKQQLRAVEGIDTETAERISVLDRKVLDDELRLIEKRGVAVISAFDPSYPENLKNTYSPPLVLYVKGCLKPEDADAVAIVGSRLPSRYGMTMCEKLAYDLAIRGITVVSGLARGIDTMAHSGSLKAGRTIAVLGSGLNRLYPPENRRLAEEISEGGAVISEFPMNTPPFRHNFPRRNRIISGLALGVVVVEASERSGSLITARFALDENREVFAVPGQVGTKTSIGANSLIKEGAKLVEDWEDVISEIRNSLRHKTGERQYYRSETTPAAGLTDDENTVKGFLSQHPLYIDELAQKTRIDIKRLNSVLLSLELKHVAKELPGKTYVLR